MLDGITPGYWYIPKRWMSSPQKNVAAECGLCEMQYSIFVPIGKKRMLECPDCKNTTLQLIRA